MSHDDVLGLEEAPHLAQALHRLRDLDPEQRELPQELPLQLVHRTAPQLQDRQLRLVSRHETHAKRMRHVLLEARFHAISEGKGHGNHGNKATVLMS